MKLLLWLQVRLLVNAIRNLRGLRLVVAIVFALSVAPGLVAMVGLWFVPPRTGSLALSDFSLGAVRAGLVGLLMLSVFTFILSGFTEGLLAFSTSDLDFLFPAPFSRRAVLAVRLCVEYLKVGLLALATTLWLGAQMRVQIRVIHPSALLLSALAFALFFAFALNLCSLANILYTFHFERLHPIAKGVRAAGVALVALVLAGVAYAVPRGQEGWGSVFAAANSRIVSLSALPIAWTADLALTPVTGFTEAWPWKLLTLAVLVAATFVVLVCRKENVYEATLGVSLSRARRRQALRGGGWQALQTEALRRKASVPVRFGLPPLGSGGRAVLWKNACIGLRNPGRILAYGLLGGVAPVWLAGYLLPNESLLTGGPFLLAYLCFILSSTAANTWQGELTRANILKAIPIPPWHVVAAHVAPSACGFGVYVLVAALSMGVCWAAADRWVIAVVATGAATLFPLYVAIGSAVFTGFSNPRDPAQKFIGAWLMMLFEGLATVPAALVGGGAWAIGLPAGTAAVAVAAVNLGLTTAVVGAAGEALRKFDPTD